MSHSLTLREQFNDQLPVHAVPGSHHTCRLCGGGCRSYDVMLTEQEARRLSLPMWRPYLNEVPDDAPLVIIDSASQQYTLNKVGGRCVFLDTDNLCIIHKEAGATTKPLACQFFPLLAVQTPEETRVSLNVGCRRLIEMTDQDAPLQSEDARAILTQVHALTTVPAELAFTPDQVIPFEALKIWCADLTAKLSTDGAVPARLKAAASVLYPAYDAPPALDTRTLFRELRRLITTSPPVRPTLTALYARTLPWLDRVLTAPTLSVDWPTPYHPFFASVGRQHIEGYQFSLHRTARTGFIAFLAALVCVPFAADLRILDHRQTASQQMQNESQTDRLPGSPGAPMRADHMWNEALSDAIDLFLTPAGQIALTEPNQQAFLRELVEAL